MGRGKGCPLILKDLTGQNRLGLARLLRANPNLDYLRPRAKPMLKNRTIVSILLLPSAAYLFLFFIVPMLGMMILSLRPDMRGGPFQLGWSPTPKHYQNILTGDVYLPLLWLSIRVAFAVALIATLLAYPLAYFLVFHAGKRASLLLTLAILPFWTSYLLRIVAWKTILGSNGLINNL